MLYFSMINFNIFPHIFLEFPIVAHLQFYRYIFYALLLFSMRAAFQPPVYEYLI
jgi:hypothetical protein